jgi:hypothetical protein
LGLHLPQPRKDRLVGIAVLRLYIDQDDAHLLAVQDAAMLLRDVENAVVGDGLKFDGIHRSG